jgi:hypothetical protein
VRDDGVQAAVTSPPRFSDHKQNFRNLSLNSQGNQYQTGGLIVAVSPTSQRILINREVVDMKTGKITHERNYVLQVVV